MERASQCFNVAKIWQKTKILHVIFLKLITKKKETLSWHYTIMILVLLVELKDNSWFLQLMNIPKQSESCSWTIQQIQKLKKRSCNWVPYYQENVIQELEIPCSSDLLPLINKSINSPAMVKHCMTVTQKVVYKVKPGQILIITADQPLRFTQTNTMEIFKWFWWRCFLTVIGGLHIEMVMLRVLYCLILLAPNLSGNVHH